MTLLQYLRDPIVWVMGGKPATLGRPSDVDVDYCFNLMQCWVKLAQEECRAEYPDFELAQSFGVFNVSAAFTNLLDKSAVEWCERLAKFSDINPQALFFQLQRVRPIVAQEMRVGRSERDSWVAVIRRLVSSKMDLQFNELHQAVSDTNCCAQSGCPLEILPRSISEAACEA